MLDEKISNQLNKDDTHLICIKDIMQNIDDIQKELNAIRDAIDNSKTEGDAIEKIRTFEGIAKTRYHVTNIIVHSKLLNQSTLWLERDIIEMENIKIKAMKL